MDLSVHNPYIMSAILIPDLVSTGPVGGPFLHEGPHEIVHDDEFQVGLVELINTPRQPSLSSAIDGFWSWTDSRPSRLEG